LCDHSDEEKKKDRKDLNQRRRGSEVNLEPVKRNTKNIKLFSDSKAFSGSFVHISETSKR
jgi:hypothetical protein